MVQTAFGIGLQPDRCMDLIHVQVCGTISSRIMIHMSESGHLSVGLCDETQRLLDTSATTMMYNALCHSAWHQLCKRIYSIPNSILKYTTNKRDSNPAHVCYTLVLNVCIVVYDFTNFFHFSSCINQQK